MNNGKSKNIIIVCLAVCLIAAVFMCAYSFSGSHYQPTLRIIGDVENVLEFRQLEDIGSKVEVELDGKRYQAVRLSDLLESAVPQGDISAVFYTAPDGFSPQIAGDSLEHSYLGFDSQNGWHMLNLRHPISANAKHLQYIAVITKPETNPNPLVIENGNGRKLTTVGALYAGAVTEYPYLEGQAERAVNDTLYTSTVYTRRICVSLPQLGITETSRILLSNKAGEEIYADDSVTLQLCGNRLDFIDAETRRQVGDITLIIAYPPGHER